MTGEKLISLFRGYLKDLTKVYEVGATEMSEDMKDELYAIKHGDQIAAHLCWMCKRGEELVNEKRIEKAMRWLGFVQGFMFRDSMCSIENLKRDSMPAPEPVSEEQELLEDTQYAADEAAEEESESNGVYVEEKYVEFVTRTNGEHPPVEVVDAIEVEEEEEELAVVEDKPDPAPVVKRANGMKRGELKVKIVDFLKKSPGASLDDLSTHLYGDASAASKNKTNVAMHRLKQLNTVEGKSGAWKVNEQTE